MAILDYKHFYFVGIKGVAMTALAQCLLDAQKKVTGADVALDFVSKEILKDRQVKIDHGFEKLSDEVDCLIYSAAHSGPQNPLVIKAKERGIPCFSQAKALGELSNKKKTVAVCGVGGKSTISAMIVWVLEKLKKDVSYTVGVGDILGLNKTGRWSESSEYFVTEADEYVTDPESARNGKSFTPRFAYLNPSITVCSRLAFDHPDVYRDFSHTKQVFTSFFKQISDDGTFIYNATDEVLTEIAKTELEKQKKVAFNKEESDFSLLNYRVKERQAFFEFSYKDKTYECKLKIPGIFNAENALAAIAACKEMGIKIVDSCKAIESFQSTKRRFEFLGEIDSVRYYDDYAHHPSEVEAAIEAFKLWEPKRKRIVAFQPHTYSRTKSLFDDFVQAFSMSETVIILDIFASARERKKDYEEANCHSPLLAQKIKMQYPNIEVLHLQAVNDLAEYCLQIDKEAAFLSLGAGDIYEFFDKIKQ